MALITGGDHIIGPPAPGKLVASIQHNRCAEELFVQLKIVTTMSTQVISNTTLNRFYFSFIQFRQKNINDLT